MTWRQARVHARRGVRVRRELWPTGVSLWYDAGAGRSRNVARIDRQGVIGTVRVADFGPEDFDAVDWVIDDLPPAVEVGVANIFMTLDLAIDDDIRIDLDGVTVIDRQRVLDSGRRTFTLTQGQMTDIRPQGVSGLVAQEEIRLRTGMLVEVYAVNVLGAWRTTTWSAVVYYTDGSTKMAAGGAMENGGTAGGGRFPEPEYRGMGSFVL